jgi:hypothetical protein
MMLADSCESTVRARKPANKAEIVDIVDGIIDNRMRDGQLDESNLTMRDLSTTRDIFIEMLQAVFHPRINYPALPPKRQTQEIPAEIAAPVREDVEALESVMKLESGEHVAPSDTQESGVRKTQTVEIAAIKPEAEEDAPMSEVPPLRRTQRLMPVENKEKEQSKD